MPNVVIFGANLGAVPMIWNLRRRGFRVIALGHDPTQSGALLADEFHLVDYRDPESMARALEGRAIAGFVPGAHDLYYRAYTEYQGVRQGDRSKRLAAYEAMHNKRLFRKRLQALAPNRCPAFACTDEHDTLIPDADFFPALFKPEHAGGGRGIFLLRDVSAFKQQRSELTAGIVEKCLDGVDLSLSLWLDQGRCIAGYVDREVTFGTQFRITGSISSNDLIQEIRQAGVMDELADILSGMEIRNGFAHCQIRMASPKVWHVIEFTLRMPGDAYPLVPELFGNLDYTSRYLAGFVPGLQPDTFGECLFEFASDRAFGRVCLFSNQQLRSEYFKSLEFPSHTPENPDAYKVCFFMSYHKLSLEQLLDPSLQLAAEG